MQHKTMNDNKYTLGNYIADLRLMRSQQCADVAKKINISTAYLSQIEHGIRKKPNPQIISALVEALKLSFEEATTLFDLYAETTGNLPPDITEYLTGNSAVQRALRQARDANATEEDWERFIEQLKK